jgi:hypothetical protein
MTSAYQTQEIPQEYEESIQEESIEEESIEEGPDYPDYTDLSEMVCHLWECLTTDPCYALVSVSNEYVKELLEADLSVTMQDIQQAINLD